MKVNKLTLFQTIIHGLTAFLSFLHLPLSADSLLIADSIQLKQHVKVLTSTSKPRNYQNTYILDSIAAYIKSEFIKYGFEHVSEQCYEARGKTYRNVIASVGPPNTDLIVIGAHYDVFSESIGADDNASGIAGLLETARVLFLMKDSLKNRIEFVAYSLEEPPFFRSRFMGSYVHASSLSDNLIKVKLMICYDMIGYYNDQKKSQEYPLGILKLFYGTKGNFIACASNMKYGRYATKLRNTYNKQTNIRSISVIAPAFMQGIDFSDHRNYWGYKMPAIMVTDGAFYRNNNYHTIYDTMEKLNFSKMVEVVNGVARFVLQLR